MKSVILLSLLLSCSLAADYTVYAGFDVNGWISLNFFPSILTVTRGDTVTFVPLTDDLVITFAPQTLPMFLGTNQNGDLLFSPTTYQPTGGNSIQNMLGIYSSGFLSMGKNWTVSFPNTGIFQFYNAFGLPWMTGTILVVDNSRTLIPPSSVDTLARAALVNVATNVFPDLTIAKGGLDTIPSGRRLADGTFEWTVRMTGDLWTLSSYARFLPSNFTIGVGDTILFVNDDITIHTVSFNSSGMWMKDIFNDSNGYLVFNGVFAEKHEPTMMNYTGGFANSGLLLPLSLRPRANISEYTQGIFNNTYTFNHQGANNDILSAILSSNMGQGQGLGQGQGQGGIVNNNQGQGGITNNNNNFGTGATNNNNNLGGGITNTNNNMGGTITNNNLGGQGQAQGGITNNNNNMGAGATNNNNNLGGNLGGQGQGLGQGQGMMNATMPNLLHFWRIKFGVAGVFPYRCDIHFDDGMVGQIIVRQRNVTASAMK